MPLKIVKTIKAGIINQIIINIIPIIKISVSMIMPKIIINILIIAPRILEIRFEKKTSRYWPISNPLG